MDAFALAAELIAASEDFRAWPYPDPASPLAEATTQHRHRWGTVPARGIMATLSPDVRALSGSPWTVGYGATGPNIGPDSPAWTRSVALANLQGEIEERWEQIDDLVRVPLAPEEKAALLSLHYNIGQRAFAQSTLLRLLNKGDRAGAAAQFARWNRAGGRVLPGLVTRRENERCLFLGLHPLLRKG